ncbi:Crp/Fnr family transcriptional regulator [Hydrococcus rivularis NIES-593]|uniref:Crp/Fnr family transcriptional regulator n=1 Tax=Hydrococcus rivularis NIES-593 TaxID=1921803 RepID=A0A1U7HAM8_9CYAN|nr:helix-turn-helix domain-containing protein [Hydrococcus rivularis]OKH20601.1 Crp/Fnr family transcriptional regulator [Hydrococcus rivularis NIES-593]
MEVNTLVQRLKHFQKNLYELYQESKAPVQKQPDRLLPAVYKELGTASEALQVAVDELIAQTEKLAAIQMQLETERQNHKNLFDFLSEAHLVTDPRGKILQANQAAADLLKAELRFLLGKPLDIFFTPQERQTFPAKLSQVRQCDRAQKWRVDLQPRNGETMPVSLTVAPSRDASGKLIALNWNLCEIAKKHAGIEPQLGISQDLSQSRPKHVYQRGEIIPLEPTKLWLVCQGWVKLSTTCESGDEVIVGLAGRDMSFGSSMTSLSTYQAIALSEEVQLVAISLSEIDNSPRLKEIIFSQIAQRLRLTESLLAISGVRQVEERVYHFLLWLKQHFGQKVPQGDRLSVRLTHQELANACSTTRVTITRVLGKLKKQGKITYDSKHHIIFTNAS